jgi:tRNA-(ms[2]io[6]A)-hydroxylase
VLARPLALLADHAQCELGAAAAGQALIARYPDRPELVERMSALAIEELRHFRRVHRLLRERGGTLPTPSPNPYAEGLLRSARGSENPLLDRLLVAALIERRSLERFELLADAAEDPELASLFAELGPSEAGHGRLFLELAREVASEPAVHGRLQHWTLLEARLIQGLAFGFRIHSGPPTLEKTVPAVEEGQG